MRKLLVSAYGCEPFKGSESGVGWELVKQLACYNEVWVLTRANNQILIEKSEAFQNQNLHFLYYDLSDKITRFKKGEKGLYWYYVLWQLGAKRYLKKIVNDIRFDYSIHLTFGSIWLPFFIHSMPVPFVWGPVGGGESIPKIFYGQLSAKERISQRIRSALIMSSRINPLICIPAGRASKIIVRTEDTLKVIPKKYRYKASVLLETGMEVLGDRPKETETDVCNIVYVGRLIRTKGVSLIPEIVKRIHTHQNFKVYLIGDGSLRKEMEKQCQSYGISDKVEFMGKMTHDDTVTFLKKCEVFLFPSFKEGGSWALLEAMAEGLAVVCLDLSGMHIITDEESAIRLKAQSVEQVIQDFSESLEKLIGDKNLRAEMGRKARERVKNQFNWNYKGDFLENVLFELEEL